MPMEFRALLLDAAGTLIEPAEPVSETYRRIFALHGFETTRQALEPAFHSAFQSHAGPDFDRFPDGHHAERAWWRAVVETAARQAGIDPSQSDDGAFDRCFTDLFDHYARGDAWRLFPELSAFLDQAAGRGLRLAIVSNFDHRLHQVLNELRLTPRFEFILSSGEAACRKPAAGIFHQALRCLNLQPPEVFHIGDTPETDLAGARSAGIPAALVDRPDRNLLDILNSLPDPDRKPDGN